MQVGRIGGRPMPPETMMPGLKTVIGRENKQGIFCDSQSIERGHDLPDTVINHRNLGVVIPKGWQIIGCLYGHGIIQPPQNIFDA